MKFLLALMLILSVADAEDDVLHFAFELSRHGARSGKDASGYVIDSPSTLTASGMR